MSIFVKKLNIGSMVIESIRAKVKASSLTALALLISSLTRDPLSLLKYASAK
jgi:hypothetical protein